MNVRSKKRSDSTIARPVTATLSVVIPVYNEEGTILRLLERVRRADPECEIVVVDDGSQDGTAKKLAQLSLEGVKVVTHPNNLGKGASIRTGLKFVTGDIVTIQDADLEYDPGDLEDLVLPIRKGEADVIYGNRFSSENQFLFLSWLANRLITFFCNRLLRTPLHDVESCYKVMRRDVVQRISSSLEENGFGIEIELAFKLDRVTSRIDELPIRYAPRRPQEGKKIRWWDGLWALRCIFWHGVLQHRK